MEGGPPRRPGRIGNGWGACPGSPGALTHAVGELWAALPPLRRLSD